MSRFRAVVVISAIVCVTGFPTCQSWAAESLYDAALREGEQALKIQDYARASKMFEIAVKECDQPGLVSKHKINALNNLAGSYFFMKDEKKAQDITAQALELCTTLNSADPLVLATRRNYDRTRASTKNQIGSTSIETNINEEPSVLDHNYTWSAEDPQCEKEIVDGSHVETISAEGFRVSAALIDTGWKYRVDLCIKNVGDKTIDLSPAQTSLSIVGKNNQRLKYEDAGKLAASFVRKARIEAACTNMNSAMYQANAAMQKTTTTALINSSGTGTFGGNAWTGNGYSTYSGFGSYFGTSLVTVSSPDYGAMQQARRQSEICQSNSVQTVQQAVAIGSHVEAIALKPNTIKTGKTLSGAVFFERRGTGDTAIVTLPLGDSSYSFKFAVNTDSAGKKIVSSIMDGRSCFRTLGSCRLLGGKSAQFATSPHISTKNDSSNNQ